MHPYNYVVKMQSLDDNEIVELCAFKSKADAEQYARQMQAEAEGTHKLWVDNYQKWG